MKKRLRNKILKSYKMYRTATSLRMSKYGYSLHPELGWMHYKEHGEAWSRQDKSIQTGITLL